MADILRDFCNEFDFPGEAESVLSSTYAVAQSDSEFMSLVRRYDSETNMDFASDVIPALVSIAERLGEEKYTLQMLYFILLSPRLEERYIERGIDTRIWHDSMYDLHCKLFECHKRYGIWGTSVATWYPKFFLMTRFALGRLQFEVAELKVACRYGEHEYPLGTRVIQMHIPSSGPLYYDECLESYRRAVAFFADELERPALTPFVCDSWLLFPLHREILPPTSRIRRFMSDFTLLRTTYEDTPVSVWRIFGTDYNGDPSTLPRDNSLRRAYADILASGGKTGTSYGIFFHDGEKIIK